MRNPADTTGAPSPRECAEVLAKSRNLAHAADTLGISVHVLKTQFEELRKETAMTVDVRRDLMLNRLETGMAALMPAVEAGDGSAMHALSKLTREATNLVPGLRSSTSWWEHHHPECFVVELRPPLICAR